VVNLQQNCASIWNRYIVINDKSQGSIAKHLRNDDLSYYIFITQSAGERIFFKLVNICRNYRQNDDCFLRPIRIALLSSKMLISPDKLNICVLQTKTVTNRCYVNRQIMWVYYQQASNFCRPLLIYWLTDWRHQWLTDYWSCTAFCRHSFSLLWQLCTVGHGIFYMADVNNFL